MPTPILQKPIATVATPLALGSLPQTTGKPAWIPTDDQIPLAVDVGEEALWAYTDGWVKVHRFRLGALEEVSLRNIANLENALRIPVAYEAGKEIVEGYLTLKELKQILDKVSE